MDQIILIYQEEEASRIDKYLANELEDVTRSQVQLLINDEKVLVNDIQKILDEHF